LTAPTCRSVRQLRRSIRHPGLVPDSFVSVYALPELSTRPLPSEHYRVSETALEATQRYGDPSLAGALRWWIDAAFNQIQIPALLVDLRHVAEGLSPGSTRDEIENLVTFVDSQPAAEPIWYLVFLGE
jgi:hypothetical protein